MQTRCDGYVTSSTSSRAFVVAVEPEDQVLCAVCFVPEVLNHPQLVASLFHHLHSRPIKHCSRASTASYRVWSVCGGAGALKDTPRIERGGERGRER